jgi:(1->4)-alpha-D-glucan 1-alpha-D-glucosylmutase
MVNSLSQLVLKLASPGVPDFYQGTELWDLTLVDPDNRREVDFGARRRLLAELRPVLDRLEQGTTVACEVQDLFIHWYDGRIKFFVTTCGMRFRRQHSELMLHGAYTPLELDGERADRAIAFARHDESGTLLVVAPRLIVPLVNEERPLPIGRDVWASDRIVLPSGTRAARYRHLITGEWCETTSDGSSLSIAAALRSCPVALLWAPAPEQ